MKMNIFLFISIAMLFLASSCKKDIDNPNIPDKPDPADTLTLCPFRLLLKGVHNQPNAPTSLKAIVTIKNNLDEKVFTDTIIAIEGNDNYRTTTLKLPKGNYKLSGLLIRQGDTTIRYATPLASSPKAALIAHPLSVPLALDQKTEKVFPVDVLPVMTADKAEDYGYPTGSFGNNTNNPDNQNDKRIFIRPLIKIGDIIYDSIPVQLIIRSWDNQNNMEYKALYLAAGMNEIYLPKNKVRYQLSVSKWNTYDEIILTKDEVQENAVYIIGGDAAAKRLKTVYEYKLINGTSIPQTKSNYEYYSNGELKQISVLGKRDDLSTYLLRKEVFEYQHSKITGINVFDEDNALLSTSSFRYMADGKMSNMKEDKSGVITNGTVNYVPLETGSGISQDYRIDIQYSYSHNQITSNYSKTIIGGNVFTDYVTNNNGNSQEGMYNYDFSINPYAHLGIPDIYMSQHSKHNKKSQWKTYYGAYPLIEEYDFVYTYNGDGYPTSLLTKYRSFKNKSDVYTIKTVFEY